MRPISDRPLSPLNIALLIGVFGAAGALSRHGLSTAAGHFLGTEFPWGTALVNILGCFLFGLIWTLSEQRGLIPLSQGILVLTGFVGSFTTFSTFTFETDVLMQGGQWGKLALHILGQNLLGFASLELGFRAGRKKKPPDPEQTRPGA